ncbi:MAG: malate synthase A [Bdellovibrionales bacterium GWB1_55_8]|nr:MAG: malate synthase A [Bdellovibrionales bacterium GWB1_55_8]
MRNIQAKSTHPRGVELLGTISPEYEKILTTDALKFLETLHQEFEPRREAALRARTERQKRLDQGERPDFLASTRNVRESDWKVATAPADLDDRRVEITGPVERKMMINALNSGASVFMADFEDALSPSWNNLLDGQINCREAVRKRISYESPEGKSYRLKPSGLATFMVRPRGWHLSEPGLRVDEVPISGSLFDFGLYFFHNARDLLSGGSGPYFYLPKLENHLEARLWRDVFAFSEQTLGIPPGSIRATVLIETILAAFEMEEILYELRDYAAGLNAGRWDYIFSIIKKFSSDGDLLFPDRAEITMNVPFMRTYAQLLVKTCHKRGAHAIGGMSAYVPSRKDPDANENAIRRVRDDKEREAVDGFDGTWVAHPDLVPVAKEVFDRALGSRANQKDRLNRNFSASAHDLLDFVIPGSITETGVRGNIRVALQYLDSWISGSGAVTIQNLMEDAATAEIARAELWQWVHHGAKTKHGDVLDARQYRQLRGEEQLLLRAASKGHLEEAAEVLDGLVLSKEFPEFLTYSANRFLSDLSEVVQS